MDILYFTNDVNKYFIGEPIIKELDISLLKVDFTSWRENVKKISNGTLIIIDYSADCKELDTLIYDINSKRIGIASCILIVDEMDFSTKVNYYNMGISAILPRTESLEKELRQFFLSGKKEFDILKQLEQMKIAVLDDSILSLKIIESLFCQMEVFDVLYYRSAVDVLDHLKEYDLFIVDLVLPQYSGLELAHRIKKENPKAVVIIMTAYSEGISISQIGDMGADDFLIKPFDLNLFSLRLIACMKNKILYQEKENGEKRLYELATKDTLTNLFNRRYFVEFLDQQVEIFIKNEVTFSLILLDIDHFKNINDAYGHMAGDIVLKEVAGLLKRQLRESDPVCRWGGEEFIIFLLETQKDDAEMIAEKLRKSIEDMKIDGVSPITASFGVTQWKEDDTITTIFQRVDNSLYLAKLTGRNKVVSNEEISIYKGGLPVNIEWGPFFRSGNVQIDNEHSELISLSNELILNTFQDKNFSRVCEVFDQLLKHIVTHFENEEHILKEYNYCKFDEHKEIHASLVEKTLYMMNSLKEKKIDPIELSQYVIQEVVIGHIIKCDFQFFDLFQKNMDGLE